MEGKEASIDKALSIYGLDTGVFRSAMGRPGVKSDVEP
jgi:hypothetical protein